MSELEVFRAAASLLPAQFERVAELEARLRAAHERLGSIIAEIDAAAADSWKRAETGEWGLAEQGKYEGLCLALAIIDRHTSHEASSCRVEQAGERQ